MCRLASFVLTKDKELWLPDSESHSEIIERFSVHEYGARGPNVVKVEIVPPDGSVNLRDLDGWRLSFDQDVFPEWHDPATSEARVRSVLREKLVNLTTLYASDSQIKDVSGLVNLTTLYASDSQIKDVSGLVNLTTLDARNSQIKDVSGLVNLTTLDARNSQIKDVSGLVNLTTLYASDSQIKDVSGLVNLTTLDARNSQIKDVSGLVRRGVRVYRW